MASKLLSVVLIFFLLAGCSQPPPWEERMTLSLFADLLKEVDLARRNVDSFSEPQSDQEIIDLLRQVNSQLLEPVQPESTLIDKEASRIVDGWGRPIAFVVQNGRVIGFASSGPNGSWDGARFKGSDDVLVVNEVSAPTE